MRVFVLRLCLLQLLVLYSIHAQGRPPNEGDSHEKTEENEDEFHEEQVGTIQRKEHNADLGAIVVKPGSNPGQLEAAKEFFQETSEENPPPRENGPSFFFKGRGVVQPHFFRNRENSDEEEENTEKDLLKIDPLDPEEIEKRKFYGHNQETFDRILKINNKEHASVQLMEGDMALDRTHNGANGELWTKMKVGPMKELVPIPYKISNAYNSTEVGIIKSAMRLYTQHTCIRFVPRKTEIAYIYISDGKGCWAYVGKTGYSAQTVSLGIPGCVAKGIAAHEFMHVVGFQHEHSRSDRDKYVTILKDNIQKDMRTNFEIYNNTKNLVIYDYNSVMHYSKSAFSKFQYLPAIQIKPKQKPEPEIGQRERMSPYDIEEIKYLYNCGPGTYQRCGRNFFNQNVGVITSPKYPANYPAESHCTWKITVAKRAYVAITFKNIEMEDSPLCQKDAILIHDGENAAAPRLASLCGSPRKEITVRSTGNTLFVMFTSDPSKSNTKGFSAIFRKSSTKGTLPTPPTQPKLKTIRNSLSEFDCNFESGACGMVQDTLDELDWIRYKGRTPSVGTGPSYDHTTRSGYYMYVESSLPSKIGDNAILRTPWMKGRGSCLTFSYHMYGSYMGTLRLYAYEKRKNDQYGHEVLLWEKHGNQGNQWITHEVAYKPTASVENVQFYWEAFVFFYQSDIGLDDVKVKDAKCSSNSGSQTTSPRVQVVTKTTARTTRKTTTTTATTTTTSTTTTTPTTTPQIATSPVQYVECDFDSGFCGWTQDKNDIFDWSRSNKGTDSHNTGPAEDHTSGKGYFLFIEASAPRVKGDVARLLSPRLTRKPHCLKMWYHMYGTGIGQLLVKQITDGSETVLVDKQGNSGDTWLYEEVDIVTPIVKSSLLTGALWKDEAYTQIAIDGIRDKGFAGDLAIDDITITDSSCRKSAFKPAVSRIAKYSKSLTCNFDTMDDKCGFRNGDSDAFDWDQVTGKTPSQHTGPNADHTKGDNTGSYMFIEASSPRSKGDQAQLISPKLASGIYCVSFFVHMWGSGMGSVEVYTLEHSGNQNSIRRKQWKRSGTQGNQWQEGTFEFETAMTIQYVELEFLATVGPSFTSDAALDDVTVASGRCQSPIPTKTSTTTTTTQRPTTTRMTTRKTTTTTKKPTTTTTTTTTKRPTTTTTTTTTAAPTTTTTTTTMKPTTPTTTKKSTTMKPTKTATTRRVIRPTKGKPTTKPKPTKRKTLPTRISTTRASKPTKRAKPKPTSNRVRFTKRPRPRKNPKNPRRKNKPTTSKAPATKTTQASTKAPSTPKPITSSLQVSIHPKVFSCDFDSQILCGLEQSTIDNFDWKRQSGNTPSSGTGPLSDHTYGLNKKGYYLFIEGSNPNLADHKAIVVTPPLSAQPTERCVIFWYHLFGDGVGELNLYSELSASGNFKKVAKVTPSMVPATQLEFSVQGNKGNVWKMARVGIKKSAKSPTAALRFYFEGIRGSSFRSDIAIDDICITAGPCGPNSNCNRKPPVAITKPVTMAKTKPTSQNRYPTTAPVTTKAARNKKLPAEIDSLKGLGIEMPFCSFDTPIKLSGNPANDLLNDMNIPVVRGSTARDLGQFDPNKNRNRTDSSCGWEQEQDRDKFDWERNSGETKSGFTGPNGDHTTGKGHYMFIESSVPRVFNDIAILKSKKLYPTSYCVDLYYNMNGKGTGSLLVRSQQELNNGRHVVQYLKSIRGEQGEAWGRLRVTYKPRSNIENVQFRIEGVRGKDYTGDIAIDDVSVTPGQCDACSKPNHQFKNSWGAVQKFSAGCVNDDLFFVRCCSSAREKVIYRRVEKCAENMFAGDRLDWMCNFISYA